MTTLTRDDIAKNISSNPKVVQAFETIQRQVAATTTQTAQNVADTQTLQDATAVLLSADAALGNARVLAVDAPLAIQDQGAGGNVVIGFDFPFFLNGGYRLTINLLSDTDVTIPSGTLVTQESLGELNSYANDAAAAVGGVAVGGLYRNGSALMIRVS